jgi:hypothetical protein
MALANSTLNQLTLAESLSLARPAEPAELVNPGVSATSCSFHLNQLVKQIDPPKVREIVGTVFEDLLRLLECLRPIESHLRHVDEAEETFALLQLIHDEACALVKFITEDALTCEAMSEELSETLDGIAFAVSHDLQRVFETQQRAATAEKTSQRANLKSQISNAHVVVGKLYRAHDVLTNCLQQATISLATMFDPELVGTKLFDNYDMRYRQSLQLCEDLSRLLELVEACGEKRVEPAFANLTAGIEKFRNESRECLRYSDWPQFESFCERIQLAATPPELEPVLHQFRCYVETLLGQVRKRAVLANVFPIEFGANDIQQLPSPAQNSSTQSYFADRFPG